jgi:hypothetical protein
MGCRLHQQQADLLAAVAAVAARPGAQSPDCPVEGGRKVVGGDVGVKEVGVVGSFGKGSGDVGAGAKVEFAAVGTAVAAAAVAVALNQSRHRSLGSSQEPGRRVVGGRKAGEEGWCDIGIGVADADVIVVVDAAVAGVVVAAAASQGH